MIRGVLTSRLPTQRLSLHLSIYHSGTHSQVDSKDLRQNRKVQNWVSKDTPPNVNLGKMSAKERAV